MSTDFTIEALGGGITRLMLNRAPVNALTPAFLDALSDFYDSVAIDNSVKAIIIASGQKVFSGGLDLKAAQGFDKTDEMEIVRGLNQSFTKLYALPKPTICVVNSAAIAGGFFFVLGSDYRIGDTRASMGLAEVRVGATLPEGPAAIARAELHSNDLRKLVLNGQPYGAEQALAAGILDEVVENQLLMERALKVAEQYAALPPKTYAIVKKQLRADVVDAIAIAMENGANTPESGWFTDETKPAMVAMVGPA
jgi:enoyl-CoA hydratase/carnithine racemase